MCPVKKQYLWEGDLTLLPTDVTRHIWMFMVEAYTISLRCCKCGHFFTSKATWIEGSTPFDVCTACGAFVVVVNWAKRTVFFLSLAAVIYPGRDPHCACLRNLLVTLALSIEALRRICFVLLTWLCMSPARFVV
jgi:hypothetical protein